MMEVELGLSALTVAGRSGTAEGTSRVVTLYTMHWTMMSSGHLIIQLSECLC